VRRELGSRRHVVALTCGVRRYEAMGVALADAWQGQYHCRAEQANVCPRGEGIPADCRSTQGAGHDVVADVASDIFSEKAGVAESFVALVYCLLEWARREELLSLSAKMWISCLNVSGDPVPGVCLCTYWC
jgi:hypothetical protein